MSKKIEFRVEGTTCGSCEILLERAFRKIPGVRSVKVSNRTGRISLAIKDGVNLTTGDLYRVCNDAKYKFFSGDNGVISRPSISWDRVIVALTVALSVYFIFIRSGWVKTGASLDASAGLAAVFIIGLIAAFSSCSAVVSGLITAVAASAASSDQPLSFVQRVKPHLLFNLGRIGGFALFGSLIGLLGKMLGLSPFANGIFLLVVAIMMVGIGLNLMGAFPGGSLFGISKLVAGFIDGRTGAGRAMTTMLLGALTFFLPCGFTQSMQLFAVSTGSPFQGALIMFVFSLGTAPALLGLGIAASVARGRLLKVMSTVIGVFVIAIGYSNIASAATLLNTRGSNQQPVKQIEVRTENGEQVIQMEVTSRLEYAPDILYVRVGVPVRWEIYGDARMGCASSLVLREFGIRTFLNPGFNTVKFTPNRSGTFRFTCSMGMTQGTMIVLPAEK
ncbi:sulfite exporter TauE/SafE family protein [Patescibacteria group bacterium]|nr:sulfite exporter TauE/SafE family protein [Patescibacteria group bacterium]MBU1028668.1 sulfite exporter TauE/SafE family protein [Patescibacteria group bacterium]MBU1915707.1 sulfite exporter TauE/SafE family protein [Patescibacteria group bacterium]